MRVLIGALRLLGYLLVIVGVFGIAFVLTMTLLTFLVHWSEW